MSGDKDKRILELFAGGMGVLSIAYETQTTAWHVRTVIKDSGKTFSNGPKPSVTKEQLELHYVQRGLSIRETGEALGISSSAVLSGLKRHGIPRRSASESARLSAERGRRHSFPSRAENVVFTVEVAP